MDRLLPLSALRMPRSLSLPITDEVIARLCAGEELLLSGWVLTGRDQACARLYGLLQAKESLPVELSDQLMYFVGPSPARPGSVTGSAGPTTTGRMSTFLPTLLANGIKGFIGKGNLPQDVKDALVRYRGVYLGAIGGTGALLASSIVEVKVLAFEELLSEAIHAMRFNSFPVVVLHDIYGRDLYVEALSQNTLETDCAY